MTCFIIAKREKAPTLGYRTSPADNRSMEGKEVVVGASVEAGETKGNEIGYWQWCGGYHTAVCLNLFLLVTQ